MIYKSCEGENYRYWIYDTKSARFLGTADSLEEAKEKVYAWLNKFDKYRSGDSILIFKKVGRITDSPYGGV